MPEIEKHPTLRRGPLSPPSIPVPKMMGSETQRSSTPPTPAPRQDRHGINKDKSISPLSSLHGTSPGLDPSSLRLNV